MTPSSGVHTCEVHRGGLDSEWRPKAIDHTRLISRPPRRSQLRRPGTDSPRTPGFNRIRSDCRAYSLIIIARRRRRISISAIAAWPAVSPGINIASDRLSKALFDMSLAMIDTWSRWPRSDSGNQYFPPENEINASQAVWRDHGHVKGSKGRKHCLLPLKMASRFPPPYTVHSLFAHLQEVCDWYL